MRECVREIEDGIEPPLLFGRYGAARRLRGEDEDTGRLIRVVGHAGRVACQDGEHRERRAEHGGTPGGWRSEYTPTVADMTRGAGGGAGSDEMSHSKHG